MKTVKFDSNVQMLDLGDDPMVGPQEQEIQADAAWHGIPIEGFSGPGEEMIRATISRVPPELLKNVHCIKAAPELYPKHGRYDPETHTVNINPLIFNLRQRFGQGEGWIYHTELCLVHEIGHSIYYFLPEKTKDQWRDLSGWMVGTQEGQEPPYKETRPGWPPSTSKWTHKKGIKFTRKYAKKNDDEDFADCFAFYILNKPHQMEPSKRDFVHKIIDERVKKYPQTLIEGPTKPYPERDLMAGGPGSGCNPEVANPRCGRPSGSGLITVGEMGRVGNRRYREILERIADGKWHPLEAPPLFAKPSPRTGFYTGMRNVIRPMGFNVETRNGQIRLVRTAQHQNYEKVQRLEQPSTMDILDRGQRGELTQEQVREQLQQVRQREELQRQSEDVVRQLGPQHPGLQPGRTTTGTLNDRHQPASVPKEENTNVEGRKPKGFLAKDDKPNPEELNKDKISIRPEELEEFESYFKMSPKDYKDAILKGLPEEVTNNVRTDVTKAATSLWRVSITGPVFRMERYFYTDQDRVGHSYFVVERPFEGKDYGKQIFSNSLDMYDHLGIKTIDVHANLSVGGYAWARYGFTPSQSSWDAMRDDINEQVATDRNFTPDVKAQVRLITRMEDPKAIWLLAALKDGQGKSVGKSVLLNSDWDGKINLQDKEEYSVVRAYTESKKKKLAASALQAEPKYVGTDDSPFHDEMLSSDEGQKASDLLACLFAVRNGWSVKKALKWFKS